jgi:hypothetical protein
VTTTAPGIGKDMNIPGFDSHGMADSKTLWEAKTRRRAAMTIEEQEQREREKDFDAVWWSCWHYYSERVGEVRKRVKGKEPFEWHFASLLYNFFLRKAQGLTKLHFKLSDMRIRGRKMENNDLILLARLGNRDNLTEARKTLAQMKLVSFGPWLDNRTNYTATLLQPPARRGKKRPLSDATVKHGAVSAINPQLHWRDNTAAIDERILDELDD